MMSKQSLLPLILKISSPYGKDFPEGRGERYLYPVWCLAGLLLFLPFSPSVLIRVAGTIRCRYLPFFSRYHVATSSPAVGFKASRPSLIPFIPQFPFSPPSQPSLKPAFDVRCGFLFRKYTLEFNSLVIRLNYPGVGELSSSLLPQVILRGLCPRHGFILSLHFAEA